MHQVLGLLLLDKAWFLPELVHMYDPVVKELQIADPAVL